MEGIEKLGNEPTRALQDVVARCRPYFDRGESERLSPRERRQYYAALFQLAERGDLLSVDWRTSGGDRSRDDRQRASRRAAPPMRQDKVKSAA